MAATVRVEVRLSLPFGQAYVGKAYDPAPIDRFGAPLTRPELTRRERDVLVSLCRPLHGDDVVAQPASVKEIAAELVVTDAAVKQHLLHLYDKLGIVEGGERRRVALAREAIRLGLVEAPARLLPQSAGDDSLTAAREAFQLHRWEQAAELLAQADNREPLVAGDRLLLAEALMWANRHEESFTAKERAYRAFMGSGDETRAGHVAVLLTIHHANRHEMAVASGWLAKAQKLLEREPDSREYGYLAFVLTLLKEAAGEWNAVVELAEQMGELGRRHGDADLEALGLAYQGLAATRRGSLDEGRRLLDEAMASAVGGELGMIATGVVYCRMICACVALHDYRRAGEWTDVVDRCAHTTGLGGFPGDCRTHRTALLVKRGAWSQGEREALQAFEETQLFDLDHTGAVAFELGELRRRRGDLDGADEAFSRAYEFGFDPRAGMALVQLARGEVAAAAASIDEALADARLDALAREPLLMARVDIALAEGDLALLRTAAHELDETARAFGTPALAADAAYANGAAELTGGDATEAARLLTLAQRLWLEGEEPYEAARARELLADAHLANGKRDSARLELRAARAAFERLGARLDRERLDGRIAALV
jgi:DNA-binding CsgD family transcriptional regulator